MRYNLPLEHSWTGDASGLLLPDTLQPAQAPGQGCCQHALKCLPSWEWLALVFEQVVLAQQHVAHVSRTLWQVHALDMAMMMLVRRY